MTFVVMCGQATCSMSMRMFVEGHPPGLLLVFLLSLGADSKWDERGGNSKSVRNTQLMMQSSAPSTG